MSKRIFLAALLALSIGQSSARADAPAADAEQAVFDAVSALRAEQNLPPLVRDADLDEAALIHAEDMAAHDFVGHVSDRTGDPAARARAVGARVRRVGENVARAESTEAAIASLETSEAHRAQILSTEYSSVGIAVVEDDEGFYVVEVFGAPIAPPVAAAPVVPSREVPPPVVADVVGSSIEEDFAAAIADAEACEGDCESDGEAVAAVVREESPTPDLSAAAQPIAPQPSSVPPVAPQIVQPAQQPQSYAQGNSIAPNTAPGVRYPTPQQNVQPYPQATSPASRSVAGAPLVRLQSVPPRTVAGYWVNAGGQWWYYPVPQNARPGQMLTPSTTVSGGPAMGAQGGAAQPTYAPAQPTYAPAPQGRAGFFRASPRRW